MVLVFAKEKNTSKGYFLAGKSLTWGVIGASLFASNIATVHLVGFAESGFQEGLVWGNFEWFSVFELIILTFVIIDTILDFDMEKNREIWANLPRGKEWQQYVAKLQKIDSESNAKEKRKTMRQIVKS